MQPVLSSGSPQRRVGHHGRIQAGPPYRERRSASGRPAGEPDPPADTGSRLRSARRVLVADHDAPSRDALVQALRRQGHEVVVADAGHGVLDLCAGSDLLILNLESLDVDGVKMCRDVASTFDLPIIAAAERKCELDCVLALQAGADDYVVKPYRFRELMARIDSLMWRVEQADVCDDRSVVEYGPLRIDVTAREVSVHGKRIALTRKEFDLLVVLAEHAGEVVPRSLIMQSVWGDSWSRRTADTHVSSLRGKLGSSDWIVSVRGVGFKLACASAPSVPAEQDEEIG